MKQHPNGQPRRAKAVQGRDDDDRQTDQNFEGDGIDAVTPEMKLLLKPTRWLWKIGGQNSQKVLNSFSVFSLEIQQQGVAVPYVSFPEPEFAKDCSR
jgi:hypothetical protein